MVDDYKGALNAIDYLISQEYRNIVHLSGPLNLKISRERIRGYKGDLIKNGMPFNPDYIVECPIGTDGESQKITAKILKSLPIRPDAFFTSNDMAAVGAMLACKAEGLRIPEDVGIVGFSNWQF